MTIHRARPAALPSVEEIVTIHQQARLEGRRVKSTFTTDPRTLKAASDVLRGHPHEGFLRDRVLTPRGTRDDLAASKPVTFGRIEDEDAAIRQAHAEREGEVAAVFVGGPAALDGAVFTEYLLRRQLGVEMAPPTYVIDDFSDSNLWYSAHQLHARHGNALNADRHLTGHALLWQFLMRAVREPSDAEVLDPDFRKVDLPLSAITLEKLRIYLGNEANWLRQFVREKLGRVNEHDLNRWESVLSRDLLRLAEFLTGLALSTTSGRDPQDSMSIHIDLSEQGRKETLHENALLRERTGIESQPLDADRLRELFGEQASHIFGATAYPGDGAFRLDGQEILTDRLESCGASVRHARVDRVLFHDGRTQGHAKVAGVVTAEGEYIYASHLKMSLGYQATYRFKGTPFKPIPGHLLTTATGASVDMLLHLTPRLRTQLERHGDFAYAVTNSHWTPMAVGERHVLVRATGGGTTGVETYNPAYVINLVANTDRIFGKDALAGIVSTYGCPRAINARNSTEFWTASNFVVSYGKGGTGNTKRHAEALMSLCMMFPEHEAAILQFLDGHRDSQGEPLGAKLARLHVLARELCFIVEGQARLDSGLGL